MSPTPRLRVIGSLIVALAAAACVAGPQLEPGSPFEGARPPDEFLLTVHNHDFRDAVVYAYWNGMRDRVGTVVGKTEKTFEVVWRNETVRLGYDFIGARDGYTSELLSVTQGDHMDFVILGG